MILRAAISKTKSSAFLSRCDETGGHDKLASVSSAYGCDNTVTLQRKASCSCGGGCPSCQSGGRGLKISQPNDAAEIEADAIADRVMRMANDRTPPFNNVLAGSHDDSIPRVKTDAAVVHRQGDEATDEEPDPITEGLSTVTENLSENNPAFTEFTEQLADEFLSQPPELSVGVPVFLGANYAFLWGLAMANPAMRRHFNDFNIAMLPGIIPQFPIKTFTYRILNDEQTQFEFDFGLDASALMEAFNEGVLNTHVSTLSFESSGGLNTEAESPVSLSALQVNLGLFDDGLMLSGGFRQGVSPYPLMERDPSTGETSQIGAQFPATPDLFPGRQDVRFMLQLDVARLYNYFNPTSTPIRSVPQEVEGDVVDEPVHRKESAAATPRAATFRGVPSSDGQPLDRETRNFFEPRIGHDLGSVRIHTGDVAAESARSVNARAYTLGHDIVFGGGEYSPHSESGRHLIAHELAHVAQQSSPAATGKPPVIARVALTPADMNTLADSLHDAIASAKADEELIYVALQKLERDATAIASLKTAYKTKHKADLVADLGSRLKGQSLALAKTLLGVKGGLAVSAKAPGTPAEFETVAKTINTALVGKTIDAEAVYAALLPLAQDSSKAGTLKTTYATLFKNKLEADLGAKLKGADLSYSLYLLNAPGPEAAHAPTTFKAQPGPGTAPATAPPPVAGGAIKAETEVPWELTSGKKGQYGFGVGYSGALSADSRWVQFIEREISYDPKGGGKRTSLDKEVTAGGGKNKYRLTTSTASPNWAVDSYSASTPFFDDKSDAWRDATSVSIYDAPSPREKDIKELFDAGHTNVTSRAHFDIYLIRDYSAIYRVEIEIVWTFLDPKDVDKRKTTRTIKTTGKASGLPAALKSALVARYPDYAYIN